MKKLSSGATIFLSGFLLLPVILIGSMVDIKPERKPERQKKQQVNVKEFYRFVKANKEWFPFSYGLLKFYFE
jgi:hypothetical protein